MNAAALILSQIEATVPGGATGLLFGYGPLGFICWWLTRLVDRMRRENLAAETARREEVAARDRLLREVTDKHTTALADATHKIAGLSRALVYNAAAHGSGAIQRLAQKEVDRWDRSAREGGE